MSNLFINDIVYNKKDSSYGFGQVLVVSCLCLGPNNMIYEYSVEWDNGKYGSYHGDEIGKLYDKTYYDFKEKIKDRLNG